MPDHSTPSRSYNIALLLAAPLENTPVFQLRYRVEALDAPAPWVFELTVMVQARHIREYRLNDQDLEALALDKVRQALDRGIERNTHLYIDSRDLERFDSLRN